MKRSLLVLCALLPMCAVDAPAESTDAILARMNEASLSFRGMSAKLGMTTYTKIIDDKESETGTLKMQRLPGKATRALLNLTGQNDSHVVFLADNTVEIYYPKTKLLESHSVAKSSDLINQYLALGFGSSGKDLMDNYDIQNAGEDKVSGQDTTHLVLVPKSVKVKEKLSKIEVWIAAGKAYPVQQQFFEPNGNYRISTYSDIAINPAMKVLEFKAPAGTKREQ